MPATDRVRRPLLIAGMLLAGLLALGGKELAFSWPLLATLIVAFDRGNTWRTRLGLAAAAWVTFGSFMLWRNHAMSGFGYLPEGWRSPADAAVMVARAVGRYFLEPFAGAAITGEWWPLAMFVAVALYVVAAWRRPFLRSERGIMFVGVPVLIGAAMALGALTGYGPVVVLMVGNLWVSLAMMLLYAAAYALAIAYSRRLALLVALWGLIVFLPSAYRVHNWSGKFEYIPHSFWALWAAMALGTIVGLWTRHRRGSERIAPKRIVS